MQVFLRTASTLARSCLETADSIEVNATQRISVHVNQRVEDRLSDIAQATKDALADILELHAARAEIRRLIGHGNDELIDGLLTERDALNSQEKVLKALIDELEPKAERNIRRRYGLADHSTSSRIEHEAGQVNAALANIRQRMTTVTTGDVTDYIEVPTLPSSEVKVLKDRIATIRRIRSALNEKLSVENVRRSIVLPSQVVEVLRKHQIIE